MAERCDVLVIGAGPAGLAAAGAAASRGARVGLVDAQARAGGQVWRHDVRFGVPALARRHAAAALKRDKVEWLPQTRVVAAESGGLLVEDPQRARWLEYGALVLATGARELLLPFPGWTLPGVTGAGGLQALAKQGWPLRGKRVVVAGSGPLLLAAAATARRHGANVLGIFEQADAAAMRRFARGLWRWPARVAQAVALRARLAGVPYRRGSVVTAAHGDGVLREIEVEGPRGRARIACDQLAVGYGLVPNVELARMLGCRLEPEGAHARVAVDSEQRSSIANVFATGEACGIGGRDAALIEGAIAGLAASGATAGIASLQRQRVHARAFAAHLREHFALGARVRALAQPDTWVCRCEDVPLRALDGFGDARAAKLATRCGMGACQGRICGAALAELGRFPAGNPRPPLFPARLDTLASPIIEAAQGAVHC
ncbi:MAG: putative oxidoreductase [Rhodanobacteraceae bacterium]|jgi:NADPH-dependent 2,4-dienoyl-CoA reductase/sulfur reductase-like enzyme|nr:MAG: putative oxidoreductase [Rhodanobacteraceae bacterium]